MYDENGKALRHFSYCLDKNDLAVLGFPDHKQTVIFEAELIAVIVAVKLWKDDLLDRPVVIFVDNNSARDVAVSGSARTVTPETRKSFAHTRG